MKKRLFQGMFLLMLFIMATPAFAASISKKTTKVAYGKTTSIVLRGTRIKQAKSSDNSIATINTKGVVKGKKVGTCVVKLKGSNNKWYSCKVSVIPRISSESKTINKGKYTVVALYGTKLKAVGTSNKKVATVSTKGVVKGIESGKCYIYLLGKNGVKYKCKITVINPRINSKTKSIYTGDTYKLKLYDATLASVKSSNTKVAKVSSDGTVKGVSEGYSYITLTDKNKRKYVCKVAVIQKPFNSNLQGKKVSIIGDSISTYNGKISHGYKAWYPNGDVNINNQTWWRRLTLEGKMKLLSNCSWSGSHVSGNSMSTTYGAAGCSTKRIQDLSANGQTPDIIIVYIGINDFLHNVPVGNWLSRRNYVYDSTKIGTFTEAYALMLQKIKQTYPNAEVYCCTLLPAATNSVVISQNANRSGVNLDVYNTAIRNIADHFGVNIVDLNKNGYNMTRVSSYTIDRLHPTDAGHIRIKNVIKNELVKDFR